VVNVSVKIFCFLGTGNSLLLARRIVSKIEGSELLLAVSLFSGTLKKVEVDAVGFVFPAYLLDMWILLER